MNLFSLYYSSFQISHCGFLLPLQKAWIGLLGYAFSQDGLMSKTKTFLNIFSLVQKSNASQLLSRLLDLLTVNDS